MIKNITISGYYGFENFGDEAILSVLTKKLKTNGHNVTVFSKNPQITANKLNISTVYTFAILDIIKTLSNTDVLISGGGSLLQDATSTKSLFYYLFVIATALMLKKDVIIFAQGIGPINNKLGQILTKFILKKCKYITVRDEKSLKLLENWGIKAELVSDPVWDIEIPQPNKQNRIGIQLREWKSLSSNYLFSLANKLNEYFSDKEIIIYSFQDALDLDICKEFEAKIKEINPNINVTVQKSLTINETIEEFAKLDYLIAMRYHACLLALKYGIPTLALSYDEKVEKIAKKFNIPCSYLDDEENFENYFAHLKELNPEKLIEITNQYKFNFDNILKEIES